jgi:hypothetical protein
MDQETHQGNRRRTPYAGLTGVRSISVKKNIEFRIPIVFFSLEKHDRYASFVAF